ncbi:MAG: hypothetical protein QNJ53_26800 [Pleurocapsa sp. MO_192.B19]|nr:hypothetical protein [Pleurocapsa sp. MO_192.B19]
MTIANCPKCEKKLPPPFPSSGRQVCSACGWSDKKNESKSSNSKLVHESNTSNSSESKAIDSSPLKQIPTEQISSKLKQFTSKSEYILLAIFVGLVFSQCSKPSYEYTIASPSDYSFEESMSEYGSKGWEAVSCRRAMDSVTDDYGYECIMSREKTFYR